MATKRGAAAKKLPLARFVKLAVWALVLWAVPVLVVLGVSMVTVIVNVWLLALVVVAPIVSGLVWSRVHPRSWAPVRSRLWGSVRGPLLYRWRWNKLCLACGLTRKDRKTGADEAARLVRVRLGPAGDELHVRLLPGMVPGDFEKHAADLAHAIGVRDVRVNVRKPGWVVLDVLRKDALAEPVMLDDVPAVRDLRAVPFAIGEDGRWRHRDYANVAGEAAGGVPGSGKTAGERALAARLIQHECVQFVPIDGKGGEDWSWIADRSWLYTNEDDDLGVVVDVLRQVEALRRLRMRTQKRDRGSSEFWDLPLDPRHPLIVVTVDEVQTYTDIKSITHPDKDTETERKRQANEIISILNKLVKKGRSVGIITRLLTQKPTSESLPTPIRDNCSERTAWRVKSRSAAEAVLGDALSDAQISPTEIPKARAGMAVIERPEGGLEFVRFPFVSGPVAEHIATRCQALRRAPLLETALFAIDGMTPDGHPMPPQPPEPGGADVDMTVERVDIETTTEPLAVAVKG